MYMEIEGVGQNSNAIKLSWEDRKKLGWDLIESKIYVGSETIRQMKGEGLATAEKESRVSQKLVKVNGFVCV